MMTITEWVERRFGNKRREAEVIANDIVEFSIKCRIGGVFHLSEFLFQALCQELPQELAQEVMSRFQRRRARGFPAADSLLKLDIVMAVYERDCCAQLSNSKRRKSRVDEARVQQLCQELPRQFSAEVITRFQRRRARGYLKAEYLLNCDVAMARDEGEHYARTFGSIVAVAGR
jgi:hypothetical protein